MTLSYNCSNDLCSVVNVLGNGSCFFNAIYESARERDGLLHHLWSCLAKSSCPSKTDLKRRDRPTFTAQRDAFVAAMRSMVIQMCDTQKVREQLDHYRAEGPKIFSEEPHWMQEILKNCRGVRELQNAIKRNVVLTESWSGSLEFYAMKDRLREPDCGILLVVIDYDTLSRCTASNRPVNNKNIIVCNRGLHHYYFLSDPSFSRSGMDNAYDALPGESVRTLARLILNVKPQLPQQVSASHAWMNNPSRPRIRSGRHHRNR